MIKFSDFIKKIHTSSRGGYLLHLRGKIIHKTSQLAIKLKRYTYILIGIFLAIAACVLLILASNFQEKTIALISAFISAAATITVGVAALYANNNIAETSSKFLQKHENLLHETVDENIKQNELVLRNKIFDEINMYYIGIGNFYRLFIGDHYPYRLTVAFCEYRDKFNGETSISYIKIIDFLEKEKVMTIKAKHLLRSTRFYFDSIFDLIIAFDDYMLKFNNIMEIVRNAKICCNSTLCEQQTSEVKEISANISRKFLCYIQNIESLLNRIDDNSISFTELNVYLKTLCENKEIILKKLYEEYAKRNTSNE